MVTREILIMCLFPRILFPVLACLGLYVGYDSFAWAEASAGADEQRDARASHIPAQIPSDHATDKSPLQVNVKHDPRLGSAEAKIGIVEFSDFQCIYCGVFHRQQFARLKKEYIDTGLVQFIHKDLPLPDHVQAIPAAMAAHCAGAQGRFWEMHNALFSNQGWLKPDLYLALAHQLKLDESKFGSCMADTRPFVRGIRQDIDAARLLGLAGTPSFLLGKLEGDTLTVIRLSRGAPSFKGFAQEIEKLRDRVAPAR